MCEGNRIWFLVFSTHLNRFQSCCFPSRKSTVPKIMHNNYSLLNNLCGFVHTVLLEVHIFQLEKQLSLEALISNPIVCWWLGFFREERKKAVSFPSQQYKTLGTRCFNWSSFPLMLVWNKLAWAPEQWHQPHTGAVQAYSSTCILRQCQVDMP